MLLHFRVLFFPRLANNSTGGSDKYVLDRFSTALLVAARPGSFMFSVSSRKSVKSGYEAARCQAERQIPVTSNEYQVWQYGVWSMEYGVWNLVTR